MSLVLYLFIGLIALGYYFFKKLYSYWTERGFQSVTSSFPFGSLKGAGTKVTMAEKIDSIYKEFKGKAPVVGTFFFFDPTLITLDPELCKNICVRDFSSFHDRGFYSNKADDPLSANLLSLEGQEWRDRRVKLSPIFTSGKMKMMFDTVDTISDKLIDVMNEYLKKSDKIELKILATQYTSDVIGNVAFGLDCKCLDDVNSDFMRHGRLLFDIGAFELLKFLFSSGFPNFSRKIHLRVFDKTALDFYSKAFAQTLEYREKNGIKRNDFVSMLLGLKNIYSTDELAAEAFLIYTGGFETSSTLISFTWYELALNPEIQERLRAEIKEWLSKSDGKLSYEMIFGMQYLDQVINESLRKYPPIPNLNRKVTKDYIIPETNLTIAKGTSVYLPTYSFHHDPEYYPNPQKFDPERFSPDDDVRVRHPFTFLPFGDGPRNCIGLRFALMQSKIAVVKTLRNYKITTNDKTPIPMKFIPSAPFLAAVGGMWLSLKKIEPL